MIPRPVRLRGTWTEGDVNRWSQQYPYSFEYPRSVPSSVESERGLAAATIEDALHQTGTTPARLAARAGVSRALVRDYLLGAKQPSVAQLARLVRSLGLEPIIDLVPAYRPLTMVELGAQLSQEPESRRWRLLQEFLRGYGEAEPGERAGLAAEAPAPVDARWDALLGGVAEHLAFHDHRRPPAWSLAGERFLDRWWFPGALDGEGRTWRMMTAPAALAARGVWLERSALERAA